MVNWSHKCYPGSLGIITQHLWDVSTTHSPSTWLIAWKMLWQALSFNTVWRKDHLCQTAFTLHGEFIMFDLWRTFLARLCLVFSLLESMGILWWLLAMFYLFLFARVVIICSVGNGCVPVYYTMSSFSLGEGIMVYRLPLAWISLADVNLQ